MHKQEKKGSMDVFQTGKRFVLLVGMSLCCMLQHKAAAQNELPLDEWTYIEVDDSRETRAFGLDMADVTGDGYKDIVAGRYFYRNPGGDMSGPWQRTNLGMDVDGMLFVNVDGDVYGDIIGTALPDVYWLEATDEDGTEWEATIIAQLPETSHGNGQGYRLAQIIPGGKSEILLAAGDGFHYLEFPSDPTSGAWPSTRIAPPAYDEGIGVGDIDGDGDIDVTGGVAIEGGDNVPGTSGVTWDNSMVAWWENPGDGTGNWQRHKVGIATQADRFEVGDMDGDGLLDIIVSEERYWGLEPNANLHWYEQPTDPASSDWTRHTVATQTSMNNLDVADIDRDGDLDIVTNEHKMPKGDMEVPDNERTQIWENDGTGVFTKHNIEPGKESHLGSQLADMDGDGDLDMVSIAWRNYPYLHLWRNDAF